MSTIQAQVWKGSAFTIERKQGKAPGTVIFRFCGPLTARDMYSSLAPADFQKMLDFEGAPGEEGAVEAVHVQAIHILDLTEVPYLDSTGLGTIVNHHVRCKTRSIRLVVAGANSRVLELFQLTHVDGIISAVGTVEEAETRSVAF